jgi:signal transduction histidine kinase
MRRRWRDDECDERAALRRDIDDLKDATRREEELEAELADATPERERAIEAELAHLTAERERKLESIWRTRVEWHERKHHRAKRHFEKHHRHGPPWHPRSFAEWRMHWKLRRRLFLWFGVAIALGVGAGHIAHQMSGGKWWAFGATVVVLWMASGMIAFRLTRPLMLVVEAARRIGDGDLKTRIPLRRQRGELAMLAIAINDMASRIEKQLADQRALLAAVSHELRTPLGHVRVLVETARDTPGGATPAVYDELEREVMELDRLVDRLLASSRLDFATIERRDADIGALAVGAVERAGVPPERLAVEGDVKAAVEPTLVKRAIANLLENAETHGGGAVAVRVERREGEVAIEVDDAGPGVVSSDRERVFTLFERGPHHSDGGAIDTRSGGLGLGLALVQRIAKAHGGRAWLDERPGGGARVGFSVSIVAPSSEVGSASVSNT